MTSKQVFKRNTALLAILIALAIWLFSGSGNLPPVPPPVAPAESEDKAISRPAAQRPIEVPADGYVGSDACRDCHKHNHATWHASYHRTMTQKPENGVVFGDFEESSITFEDNEHTYRARRHSGRLWIEMGNQSNFEFISEGSRKEMPVELMTGSHHMQLYWFSLGVGRNLGLFPVVHLKEINRWVPRRSVFIHPPTDYMDVEFGRWGEACVHCHSTYGRPQIVGTLDSFPVFETEVAEFGISCESCHGPGGAHVEFRGNKTPAKGPPGKVVSDPIVNPEKLPHTLASQICGSCHSYIHLAPSPKLPPHFLPGSELANFRTLLRPDEKTAQFLRRVSPTTFTNQMAIDAEFDTMFWRNGNSRIAGREYTALSRSACHLTGEISCLSCHAMHQSAGDTRPLNEWANDQLKVKALGDHACTSCHNARTYQSGSHTHHQPQSDGSRCYNCHMPHTSYAVLKAVRNHSIDSPRINTGEVNIEPNACNLCHLDKTLAWTSHHLRDWFNIPSPSLTEDERKFAAGVLWATRGDASQRALTAWHMGWNPAQIASGKNWQAPILGKLLNDPYDAVRFMAHRSLKNVPGFTDFPFDFIGSKQHREQASLTVLKRWETGIQPSNSNRTEILLEENGQFQSDVFERLLRDRDNRLINLSE